MMIGHLRGLRQEFLVRKSTAFSRGVRVGKPYSPSAIAYLHTRPNRLPPTRACDILHERGTCRAPVLPRRLVSAAH